MISRYEAWMDDNALSAIHDALVITDISHMATGKQRNVAQKGGRNGAYITGEYQPSTTVTISFELHIYDTRKRQRVCQDVAQWANGRELKTSDRPGQILQVVCDVPPVINSAKRWTEEISMTFTAYQIPFWQEEAPAVISLSGTSANGTLYVPGNGGKVCADAKITANAALTSVTVTANDTSITLSGISVAQNGVIMITHDENGVLSIKHGSTSLLNKRTGSDELLLDSGNTNTVTVTASASVSCEVSARGVWV